MAFFEINDVKIAGLSAGVPLENTIYQRRGKH